MWYRINGFLGFIAAVIVIAGLIFSGKAVHAESYSNNKREIAAFCKLMSSFEVLINDKSEKPLGLLENEVRAIDITGLKETTRFVLAKEFMIKAIQAKRIGKKKDYLALVIGPFVFLGQIMKCRKFLGIKEVSDEGYRECGLRIAAMKLLMIEEGMWEKIKCD